MENDFKPTKGSYWSSRDIRNLEPPLTPVNDVNAKKNAIEALAAKLDGEITYRGKLMVKFGIDGHPFVAHVDSSAESNLEP